MDTIAMRRHLGDAYAAYSKAGPLVRAQVAPFMDPLLNLLGGLVNAVEDGYKGKSCSGGASCICAGRGGQKVEDAKVKVIATRAGESAQTLSVGFCGTYTGHAGKGEG